MRIESSRHMLNLRSENRPRILPEEGAERKLTSVYPMCVPAGRTPLGNTIASADRLSLLVGTLCSGVMATSRLCSLESRRGVLKELSSGGLREIGHKRFATARNAVYRGE
jgi:hypothetical protein